MVLPCATLGDVSLTPNEHDIKAGYTKMLMAVAVRHFPRLGPGEVPWPDWGRVGIDYQHEVYAWLRSLPDWEDGDMNYAVYIVSPQDYRPLAKLGIPGIKEL